MKLNYYWSKLKENKVFKRLTNKYVITFIIFAIFIIFIDKNSVLVWAQNKINIVKQERTIRQYREDILKTEEKLKELTSDKDSLEKFAREQYYFQESNEEVFLVK